MRILLYPWVSSFYVALKNGVYTPNSMAATLTYSYDALGRLTGKRYGNLNESLTYNVRGWLTGKESTPFRMRLRYATPEGGSAARWNGSLSEWEWQYGTNAAMMYGLTYDGLNRFTGAVQKQKNGNTWSALSGDYVEKGLTYDCNGNLLTLQRTAGGSVVDNLAYTYTGNQLTGLSESVRTAPSNDIYAPGSAESGSYGYDANGNLLNDSRRSLIIDYNVLNLVSEVRTGGTVTAAYTWLADGTKLGVRTGSGSDGFEYVGSLIYRKSGGGLQLSEALFGEGVIRLNDNGTQEVEYFLTDHLGSVRVIVDASGTVKERNDYYPFGARHIRSDYAQSTNRWKYNGKELQTTGELGYLDYGARMYDAGLGRWFCADPEAENNLSRSPYHFSGNNPLLNVDPDGKDYWSTNDPALIGAFMNSLRRNQGNYYNSFDVSNWTHVSDAEFLNGLTYNDKLNRFFFDYGEVINDIATRISVSLPGYQGYDGEIAIQTMYGEDGPRWYSRASGRVEQDYTIDASFIPIGKGLGALKGWLGKLFGRSTTVGKVMSNNFRSVGAAAYKGGKTLQTGGHTIKNSTAKALGISKEKLRNAIEDLKKANKMRHDAHYKILNDGNVVNPHTGEIIDNLFDYID